MFSGEYEHTVDEKGRIFLPARHREALGTIIYLGRGSDGQINVYPKTVWEEMTLRVEQAGQRRTAIRNTSRFLFSATECEVDRQGRIVIPPLLRRYADLGTDAVILGNHDRIEIWNRENWQTTCDRVIEQAKDHNDDPVQIAALELNL